MAIGEFCNREVVFATGAMNLAEAAQLMRKHHVGDLVVVDDTGGKRVPVGMITDRDMVIEVIAPALDISAFTVADIMSSSVVCVQETDGVFETLRLMRRHAIRRIPVLSQDGALAGIVSADDMLDLLAEEMAELAKIAPREQAREIKTRA